MLQSAVLRGRGITRMVCVGTAAQIAWMRANTPLSGPSWHASSSNVGARTILNDPSAMNPESAARINQVCCGCRCYATCGDCDRHTYSPQPSARFLALPGGSDTHFVVMLGADGGCAIQTATCFVVMLGADDGCATGAGHGWNTGRGTRS